MGVISRERLKGSVSGTERRQMSKGSGGRGV